MRAMFGYRARRLAHATCVWAVGRWPRVVGWLFDRVLRRDTYATSIGNGDQVVNTGWWLRGYWIEEP